MVKFYYHILIRSPPIKRSLAYCNSYIVKRKFAISMIIKSGIKQDDNLDRSSLL